MLLLLEFLDILLSSFQKVAGVFFPDCMSFNSNFALLNYASNEPKWSALYCFKNVEFLEKYGTWLKFPEV